VAQNFWRDFASTHTTDSLAFGGNYRDIVILVFLGAQDLRCFLGFYYDQYFQQFGGVPEH
jgi:hypothetical protein